MRDSIIYQDILDEGRVEGRVEGELRGRQQCLLRLGASRWDQPNEGEKAALEAITDLDRLDRMFDRMIESASKVDSWDALLQVV